MSDSVFAGFPEQTFEFLLGLSAHNDKAWFEEHRADYDSYYVAAARAFVTAIGPQLTDISPGVRFAPKINGSISRINRDVRFSRDKRPYKDHIDIWFWHGEKRGWQCPGFFLRLTSETIIVGTGMYMFPKDMLKRFRERVSDQRTAEEIKTIIASVAASGPYQIGGRSRKSPPRGMTADGASAEMLLYESLSAALEWDNSIARDPDFIAFCLGHWQKCWPIGKWTLENVWEG